MLDFFSTPSSTVADVQVFGPNSATVGAGWVTWNKPRGTSMCYMLVLGSGGAGGNGVIGANSTAGGGGGGGSGGQSTLLTPSFLLPDTLFISVAGGSSAAGFASYVTIAPGTLVANNTVVLSNGGGVGGNASGATGGTAGTAGSVSTLATMPLGGLGNSLLLAGQAGIAGGGAVAGVNLVLPVTGLYVTGGTGGGGLPATATTGTNGGSFTVAGQFPPQPGGVGPSVATIPGGMGSNGFNKVFRQLPYNYGGTGGGSSHGSATGAGLVGGAGAPGGIGCGGGGSGGALTGSTQGLGGRGGDGQVIIICW